MRDDLYAAPESANGGGLIVVVLVVGFVAAVMGANWLIETIARAL